MPGIFVSYRRADSASEVGRIVERLRSEFGKKRVFTDVFDIKGGEKFREVIRQRITRCNVVLVVIGNQWLRIEDESGRKRLENPDDYVRMEIETSLARKECKVIPVLVNHQAVPKKNELPDILQELLDRNAVNVRPDPDFADDINELCKLLAIHVPRKKTWPKYAAGALIVLAFMLGAYFLGPGHKDPEVVVQAFDARTGDRILRPFALDLENGNALLPATEHRLIQVDPKPDCIKAVHVNGFSYKSAINEMERTDNGFLIKLRLDRLLDGDPASNQVSYFDSIQPPDPASIGGWPSDEEIKRKLKPDDLPAATVTLVVKNDLKDASLDLLLYWLPPSDAPALSNPFTSRWSLIGPIEPGGKGQFDEFRLEPGFFAFYGSTNGLQARRLHCDALYKAPYIIVTIHELSESGFSKAFASTKP